MKTREILWRDNAVLVEPTTDVTVVMLNRSGSCNRPPKVQLGLYNMAYDIFKSCKFLLVSDATISKQTDRIYFCGSETQGYRISKTDAGESLRVCYNMSNQFDTNAHDRWATKSYSLKFDSECGLYYIEREEE